MAQPASQRQWAAFCKLPAPIGIVGVRRLHCAGLIQAGTLVTGQRPTHRTEIFAQLHFVACANQHCAHGRPLQQPVDGDLRHAAAGLCGNGIERLDDVEQARIVDRRAGRGSGMQTAVLRQRLAAPQLAGQPPPTERAPHHRTDALVDTQRHQLPLVVAPGQRVIRLVGDEAVPAMRIGDRLRLHQLPTGIIGSAQIAHLARAHQPIERGQGFFHRRHRIEGVQLQQIDVVGAQASQAGLHRTQQAKARRAGIVGAIAQAQAGLGRKDHLIAAALQRLAEDVFGRAIGIHICSIEQVEPCIQAQVDHAPRLRHIGVAPCRKQRPLAAERAGTQAKHGHLETGTAE
ncbi:hypothetical protein XAB3213_3210009 [Xanthomonas citri pv. bilvae]|nr:hypothetical protein XAB3213_3210009 [Xanthomonas citri pv. bilvae]